MPLETAKVYRNAETRQQWWGLDPFDWFVLGGLAWLLVTVNRHAMAINFLVVVLLLCALRVAKRGKPENHSLALVQFYLRRRPFFSAAAGDSACIRPLLTICRNYPTQKGESCR